MGVRMPAATADVDAQQLARSRIVRDLESRLLLNHGLLGFLNDFDQAPTLVF